MQKLVNQSEKNSPDEYDRIFFERQKKGVDEHDMRRWKRLLKYWKSDGWFWYNKEEERLIDLGALDSEVIFMAVEKRIHCRLIGIDLAKDAVMAMNKKPFPYLHREYCINEGHFSEHNLFEVGDVYKTRFDDSYFDYAVLAEVLEHLERPEDAIKEAMRVLKPSGVLAISVPLEEAREPGACDKERHLWSFSKQDMRELLKPYGKVKTETVGSLFTWKPPFYRYCWPSLIAFCWKK